MTFFRVAVKSGETVVHGDLVEAESPNAAAQIGRKYSQLPYNFVEVYEAGDDDAPDVLVLSKHCHAPYGTFRLVV